MANIDNYFKDLKKLNTNIIPNISNNFIVNTFNTFINTQNDNLSLIIKNSNLIYYCNKLTNKHISDIEKDIIALKSLHKNLMEDKFISKSMYYIDGIHFQMKTINVQLKDNIKIKYKYLNKFYGDLYQILDSMKIDIPDKIPRYDIVYNNVLYENEDIYILLPFILNNIIDQTNNLNNDFIYINSMEDKEKQGYYLKEYNTNLDYKLLNKLNLINNIFERIKYSVSFYLKFCKSFKNKMKKVASEIDIKHN